MPAAFPNVASIDDFMERDAYSLSGSERIDTTTGMFSLVAVESAIILFFPIKLRIRSGLRVTPTVVYIINSEKNQTLAKLAVLTAIEAGLKGESAFAAAWKILHEGKIWVSDDKCVDASNINTNIKQTLIQLVYTCIKNKINSL